MEQKASFGSLTKYGILLGLTLIVLALIGIYLNNFITTDMHFLFMLLKASAYVFFIYSAIRFAEKYIYINNYSFGQGVKTALFLGFIAALMLCIYQYIEIKYIIPEIYQTQIEETVQEMVDKGLPEDIAEKTASMFSYVAVFGAFLQTILISVLVSLFIAPFFKKKIKLQLDTEE